MKNNNRKQLLKDKKEKIWKKGCVLYYYVGWDKLMIDGKLVVQRVYINGMNVWYMIKNRMLYDSKDYFEIIKIMHDFAICLKTKSIYEVKMIFYDWYSLLISVYTLEKP